MSKIDTLLKNYNNKISIPWPTAAAAQRVIYAVYSPSDERKLRSKIGEFEITSKSLGHGWVHYDLTNSFAIWLDEQKYCKQYYQKPNLLISIVKRYEDFLVKEFTSIINEKKVTGNDVVAVSGLSSIFGFIRVRDLTERFAPIVPGRLLMFFPGSYKNNNYSLLDASDGWDYHALPITCEIEN